MKWKSLRSKSKEKLLSIEILNKEKEISVVSEEVALQGSVGPNKCGIIQAPGYTFGYCILLSVSKLRVIKQLSQSLTCMTRYPLREQLNKQQKQYPSPLNNNNRSFSHLLEHMFEQEELST